MKVILFKFGDIKEGKSVDFIEKGSELSGEFRVINFGLFNNYIVEGKMMENFVEVC